MKKTVLAILITSLFAISASAVPTLVEPADFVGDDLTLVSSGDVHPSKGSETDAANGALDLPKDCVLVMLGKFEDSSWSEEVAANFGTNYLGGAIGPLSGDPFEFSWDLTGSGYQLYVVLSKQANGDDSTQIYTVNDGKRVAGTGKIYSPKDNGWSHISFFGKKVTHDAPDSGTTLILLGTALAGLGFLRRRV